MTSIKRLPLAFFVSVVLVGSWFSAESASGADVAREVSDVTAIQDASGNTRLLFHWEPALDAEHFAIRRATLRFDLGGEAESRSLRLRIHSITSRWDPATVAWDRGWQTPGGDVDEDIALSTSLDLGASGPVALDITSLAKDVLEGGAAFEGFLVTADPADGEGLRVDDAARLAGLSLARIELAYRKTPPPPRQVVQVDSVHVE